MNLLVCLAIFTAAWYPPKLTIHPEPGSTVSDIVEIRVTANEPLRQVEFWLNGQMVSSDTSTPYTWSWDTLSSPDGEQVIVLRVVDWDGRVVSTDVRYRVDNELSRGGAYYLSQAREQLSAGNTEEAIKAARRAVRLLPEDGNAHLLLAKAWLIARQWERALESAKQAARRLDDQASYQTLAEAHIRVAFANAMDQQRQLAELRSAVEAAQNAMQRQLQHARNPAERAAILAQMGKLQEAAESYMQAEQTAANLLAAARCFLLAGRWQEAERACNLAERRLADREIVTVLRAMILSLRGRPREALQMVERLSTSQLTQLARANILLRDRRPLEALRIMVAMAASVSQDSKEAAAKHTLAAMAFAEARDFPNALNHFQQAMLAQPLNWQLLAHKGYEALATGSTAVALSYFELAARISPNDEWILCGRALSTTDRQQAIQLARQAAQQAPSDLWISAALSYALSRAGRVEEAFQIIERAHRADRESVPFASPPDLRVAGQIVRLAGRRPILPLP